MKIEKYISQSVINRLPRYYRFLNVLLRQGITRISSRELSELMMVTASQIRQDLNCFGGFGQQGYGYNVEMLKKEIGEILGVENLTPAVLIGVGNLGRAISNPHNIEGKGFKLIGAFDKSTEVVGRRLNDLTVQHIDTLEEFCKERNPKMAIICIPTPEVENMADDLISYGFKGFWNFSSFNFYYRYSGIEVVNVHLSDSIMTLSYKLSHMENL